MKQLTQSAYERAVAYLYDSARPLEQTRYAYHFKNGPVTDVLSALAAFQNDDGGFGQALEPDVRLSDSSVIATTVAFQHFREVAAPADHPMVVNACRYLMDTYRPDAANWPIIPANVDAAPHAPWWKPGNDLHENVINPRAEIIAYMNDYPDHFPTALRQQLTHTVIDYLLEQADHLEMHDLLCYLRLWNTENLPGEAGSRLLDKLKRIVAHTVATQREDWQAYALQPLSIATSPDSPFAEGWLDEIDENLDFIIESQEEHGGWMPNWSWGANWPEAWAQARLEWSGHITLGNLLTLHRFGRIST